MALNRRAHGGGMRSSPAKEEEKQGLPIWSIIDLTQDVALLWLSGHPQRAPFALYTKSPSLSFFYYVYMRIQYNKKTQPHL